MRRGFKLSNARIYLIDDRPPDRGTAGVADGQRRGRQTHVADVGDVVARGHPLRGALLAGRRQYGYGADLLRDRKQCWAADHAAHGGAYRPLHAQVAEGVQQTSALRQLPAAAAASLGHSFLLGRPLQPRIALLDLEDGWTALLHQP